MVIALFACWMSVAMAQVPSDVVVVAGDANSVAGWDTAGAVWGGGPLVNASRPSSAAFTDIAIDDAGDLYATFDGSLDVYVYDAVLGYQSVATVPGLTLTHELVGIEPIWDGHLLAAEATTRSLYEIDPVAGTASLVVSLDALDPLHLTDQITLFQMGGARAYAMVGALGEYAMVVYDFHFDTQTQYTSLSAAPNAMYVLQRPQPTWYLAMPGSPDDTLDVYRGNALRSSEALSGVTLALSQSWDGSLWALFDDSTVWRVDAQDGVEMDTTALITAGLPTSPAAMLTGAELATDACSRNPYKFTAGTCGCDYVDVPVTGGTACRHYTATVGTGVTLADGVMLESGSSVGDGATLGERVLVANQASVGANASIGDDVIIGRRSIVGAGVVLGDDVLISRSVTITSGTLQDMVSVGYGSTVSDGTLATGTILGSLVTLGSGSYTVGTTGVGTGPVFARGVTLAGGGTVARGAVLGPDITSTGVISVGEGVRVRKEATFGTGVVLGDAVRMGRDTTVGDSVEVQANSRIGSRATLTASQCLPVGTVVGIGETVSGQTCP